MLHPSCPGTAAPRRSASALALVTMVASVASAASPVTVASAATPAPTTPPASRASSATAAHASGSPADRDAAAALRTALAQGLDKAVGRLGVPNGFTSDARFTIPLPPPLARGERVLRTLGLQQDADALKTAMNRAAELAVAEAKPVFRKAVTGLTLTDAKAIVSGGDTAATDYFRRTTSAELATRFEPIVAKATAQVKLAGAYDRYAGRAAQLGVIRAEDANLNAYVTTKAMDALFTAIADEERAIRRDPLGQASSLLRRVFGAR